MERLALIVLAGLLTYLVYLVFAPFLVPLVWAVVLAVIFRPVHARIERWLARPSLAALTSLVLLTLVLIVPVLLVAGALANQAIDGAQWLLEQQRQGRRPLLDWLAGLPLEPLVRWLPVSITMDDVSNTILDAARKGARSLADHAGAAVRNVAVSFFSLFVTLLATFYLFRDGRALLAQLRDVLPLDEAYREQLFSIAHNVLYASVLSSLVVAAVQGGLGGLAFWALGLTAPVLWGVVMALLSLLPLLGAWMVWVPAAAVLAAGGQWVKALVLLVVGSLVIGTADNLLRPLLISGRAQLNGLLVFISVLGGVNVFGLVGIVLGPVLVALGVAVVQAHAEVRKARSPSAT